MSLKSADVHSGLHSSHVLVSIPVDLLWPVRQSTARTTLSTVAGGSL